MKLSAFIDEQLDSDCHDIIYIDSHGIQIEIDPYKVDLSEVIDIKYEKICVVKIKISNKL